MKSIHKYLLAASPFFILSSASAADMTKPNFVEPMYSWNGKYIGVEAGYGWGTVNHNVTGMGETGISNNVSGAMIGMYGGFNFQFDSNMVFGVDADVAWGKRAGGPNSFWTCICGLGNSVSSEVNWDAAIRGRIGYPIDRLMPYLAGGLAFGKVHADYDYINVRGVIDDVKAGWTVGTGLEYAFSDKLILRAEYRYSDFGKVVALPFLPNFDDKQSLHLAIQDVRIGIAYRF